MEQNEKFHVLFRGFGHIVYEGVGSSVGHPEHIGIHTSDIRTWYRLDDGEWFLPGIHMARRNVDALLFACKDEQELLNTIELIKHIRVKTKIDEVPKEAYRSGSDPV